MGLQQSTSCSVALRVEGRTPQRFSSENARHPGSAPPFLSGPAISKALYNMRNVHTAQNDNTLSAIELSSNSNNAGPLKRMLCDYQTLDRSKCLATHSALNDRDDRHRLGATPTMRAEEMNKGPRRLTGVFAMTGQNSIDDQTPSQALRQILPVVSPDYNNTCTRDPLLHQASEPLWTGSTGGLGKIRARRTVRHDFSANEVYEDISQTIFLAVTSQ